MAETSTPAQSQVSLGQIRRNIEGYIAVQKDVMAVMKAAGNESKQTVNAELEMAATKNGFKNITGYAEVADNIALVMSGIDPETKVYTDPATAIKKEIAEVIADKELPVNEKRQALKELNEALEGAVPVQYPSNIELVWRHYDRIDAAMQS
jgi:hypothetical protein